MQYCITNYPFLISSNGEPKESYTITNPDDLLVLVKKGFYLPESYEPKLVDRNSSSSRLSKSEND